MIDSQVHTEHLERFGARHIPRSTYLSVVHDLVGKSRIRQKWSFDEGFFLYSNIYFDVCYFSLDVISKRSAYSIVPTR